MKLTPHWCQSCKKMVMSDSTRCSCSRTLERYNKQDTGAMATFVFRDRNGNAVESFDSTVMLSAEKIAAFIYGCIDDGHYGQIEFWPAITD